MFDLIAKSSFGPARVGCCAMALLVVGLVGCGDKGGRSETGTDLEVGGLPDGSDTTNDADSGSGGDLDADAGDEDADVAAPEDTADADDGGDAVVGEACEPEFLGLDCGACGTTACVDERVVCEDEGANACGGCGELSNPLGESCTAEGVTGEAVWTCAPGTGDVVCQATGLNLCGGRAPLAGVPGEACQEDVGCGGTWVCDGNNLVRCDGLTPLNACGGCVALSADPGDRCGDCGDGVETCQADGSLLCVGAVATLNACGGCGTLSNTPGEACSDGCGDGLWTCSPDRTSVSCQGASTENSCGTCGPLLSGETAGTPCSDCGVWTCSADNTRTTCSNPRSFNACGTCSVLTEEPGSPCGCGGEYECSGGDVACVGTATVNLCGGCGELGDDPGRLCEFCGTVACGEDRESVVCENPLPNRCDGCGPEPEGFDPGEPCGCSGEWGCQGGQALCLDDPDGNACGGCGPVTGPPPGTPCGTCGTFQCAADGVSTECVDADQNLCGGCAVLDGVPGESCGECATWTCTGQNRVRCIPNTNECGGCGELEAQPGFPCGATGCGTFQCDLDGTSVSCDDAGVNACGGCGSTDVILGTQCGPCAGNVWACSTEPGREGDIVCAGIEANACGGCTPIPTEQELHSPCGSCGRFACNFATGTTECEDAPFNACGGCSPEPFVVGEACTVCGVAGTGICDGTEVSCTAVTAGNRCGGCNVALDDELGVDCGICGSIVCNGPETTICNDPCEGGP